MKRLHLFEFEDQPWFPVTIRDGMTDYLKYVANRFDFYQSVVPILAKGLQKSDGSKIIDLASGAGGGWLKLSEHLEVIFPALHVTFTDRFPNREGLAAITASRSPTFTFEASSVDARDVPPHLVGLRTQFLSLHHFKPADAKRILQNAVDAGQPIAIFEAQKRDIAHLCKFMLSPIAIALMTPMIRPFRWSRLLFTYVIPAIPAFTLWDGLVSVLRTYSTDELQEMVRTLRSSAAFSWDIGETKSEGVSIVYLLGYPK